MTAKIVAAVSFLLVACSSSAESASGAPPSQFAPSNLPAANDLPAAAPESGCAAGDPSCVVAASCTGSACGCAAGQLSCAGVCVDAAARDELTCVTRIAPDATQEQPGMSSCAPGLTACGGSCVDLSTDASNCGTCGVQCGAGACSSGKCPAGKLCATELAITTPVVTDFESYDSATPADMWSFSFNAPPGQALAVYAGPYQFSDGTGAQSLRMVAGNSSNYAASIANSSATAWGGGMGLWMGCIDASQFDGLAFDVRGTVPGGRASLSLAMQQTSAPASDDPNAGGTCSAGCQAPIQQFAVGGDWTRVLLPWKDFTPGSANQLAVPATGRDITGLSFSLALDWGEVPGAAGTYGPQASGYELALDNLGFFRTSELCAPGQQICDSRCIDPEQSNEHCGACGNACTGGAVCGGSAVGCVCPNGLSFCAGECANLANDTSHCGECSNFCSIGSTCNQGACSGGFGNTSQRCGETTRLLGNPLGCG